MNLVALHALLKERMLSSWVTFDIYPLDNKTTNKCIVPTGKFIGFGIS